MSRRKFFAAAAIASVVGTTGLAGAVPPPDVWISELLLDLPGTDDGQESIELYGTPGASLAGFVLFALDGDGTNAGTVDQIIDLGSYSLGANGVLLLRDGAGVILPAPARDSSVVTLPFNPNLENGSVTWILGFGTAPSTSTDFDTNNDGTFDIALSSFTVVDAISLLENDGVSNFAYADDVGFASEVFGPFTAFNTDAVYRALDCDGLPIGWTGGDIIGTNPGGPYLWDQASGEVFGWGAGGIPALTLDQPLDPGNVNVELSTDSDGDGIPDCTDNCPDVANPDQTDRNGNGIGDLCEPCADADGDSVCDEFDNCIDAFNPDQADTDGDGAGDACDDCVVGDADLDGVCDDVDNCLGVFNPDQTDSDGDGLGDECDFGCPDADRDGVCDADDGCPNDPNKIDPGVCGCGIADTDTDNDGLADCLDGCPDDPNKTDPGQCGCGVADTDSDNDGVADCLDGCPNDAAKTDPGLCGCGEVDLDEDSDGVCDAFDNCPGNFNPSQNDNDGDGIGDACDDCFDRNDDGVCDTIRFNELLINPPGTDDGQESIEIFAPGSEPFDGWVIFAIDGDGGTATGVVDEVISLDGITPGANGLILFRDGNGVILPGPDAETTVVVLPGNPNYENGSITFVLGYGEAPALNTDLDVDNDGAIDAGLLSKFTVVDAVSWLDADATDPQYAGGLGGTNLGFFSFPVEAVYSVQDCNGDRIGWAGGDVSGTNPGGPYTWVPGNTFGWGTGEIPALTSGQALDLGQPNLVGSADTDADGVPDCVDNCPDIANSDQADADGDGFGDACDDCSVGDADRDGVCDDIDNCVGVFNPDQADTDNDGVGDACDDCIVGDADRDGVCDDVDNCLRSFNPDQADADGDGVGDACDDCIVGDADRDGVCDDVDNCPRAFNPDQADRDRDGVGDICDDCVVGDADADGVCDDIDNCLGVFNPDQADGDGDGVGDACDTPDCPPDLNGDNNVDGADLGLLLANWGNSGQGDLNGDNNVNGADLGLLLAAWGPCFPI